MSDERGADGRPSNPGATMATDRAGSQMTETATDAAPEGTATRSRERAMRRVRWKVWTQRYGALAALVALFIYNAIDTPFFLTRQSILFILLRQGAPTPVLAGGGGGVMRHPRNTR